MENVRAAFSGFSVNNLEAAHDFYVRILGLEVKDESMGLRLGLPGGGEFFVYEKDDHQPATFTVLNFVVDDIDQTVDALASEGVVFERYEQMPAPQDENGILRGLSANMGPDIAWFKDPAGNTLSVIQDKA